MAPLGTIGQPRGRGRGCRVPGSDARRYITGQVLNVDGGLVMASDRGQPMLRKF